MRDLLVVGAGGLARETAELVRAVNQVRPTWRLLGYLDDNPRRHGEVLAGERVLGPLAAIADHPDASVVICTGSPRSPTSRELVSRRLGLAADRYARLVHPTATLPPSCVVGPGCVVLAGVVATADVTVGAHLVAMPGCVLTHDDELADWVTLGAGVRIAGAVRVGAAAYLGAGALLREGVVIGAAAVVGMGAIVLADVPPGEVWVGAPARRLRSAGPPAR